MILKSLLFAALIGLPSVSNMSEEWLETPTEEGPSYQLSPEELFFSSIMVEDKYLLPAFLPVLENELDLIAFSVLDVALEIAELAHQEGDKELYHAAALGAFNIVHLLSRGMLDAPQPLTSYALNLSDSRQPQMLALIDKIQIIDFSTDILPVASLIKDLAIIETGINPVTQEVVGDLEKSFRIGALILPGLVGVAVKKYAYIGAALQKASRFGPSEIVRRRLFNILKNAEQTSARAFGHHLSLPCLP